MNMHTVLLPIAGNTAYTIIDADNCPLLSRYRWHIDSKGYVRRNRLTSDPEQPTMVYMARQITHADSQEEVDHINGLKIDNRKANLRKITHQQNLMNSRPHKDSVCGLRGVDWHEKDGKWRARIQKNGKRVWLGNFDTAKEAAIAYDNAARALFGPFARPNLRHHPVAPH